MKKVSRVLSWVFILVALYTFFKAGTFPEGVMGVPGPGYFPRILSLIVILLAAIELISSYRDKEEEEEIKLFAKENARVWVSLGFIILYFIGLSYLGFIISTIIFMLVMLMYFRIRNIIVLVAVPIGLTTFLYFIFTILLKVQLPIGKLL